MNQNNNIFNKNEIENKLKDFKEGQDYSVSPTDEPNIKTYNFHNDKLRSVFRSDRVPVRITREAYDGKDYTYRGHFEEGKDYRYSAQQWNYDKDYQGSRGIENMPDWMRPVFEGREGGISSYSRAEVHGEAGNFHTGQKYWEARWTYEGKGNLKGNPEPKKIEPNFGDFFGNNRTFLEELEWKYNQLTDKLNSLLSRPESDFGVNGKWKKEHEVAECKRDIADIERKIEKEKGNSGFDNRPKGCCLCGFRDVRPSDIHCQKCGAELCDEAKSVKSDLQKENHDLRQQLAEVQKQLAEVLAELKKLKNNSEGQNNKELDQQIVKNERLIKNGEKVSLSEVQEQVNKSQALMKEFNSSVSSTKDNKGGNGSLPYVIGGSVVVAAVALISYYLVKKNKRK